MFKSLKLFLVCSLGFSILSSCSQKTPIIQPLTQNIQTVQQSSVDSNKFGKTAKSSLSIAERKAKTWDSNAELVKVEADNVTETGSAFWNYYFKASFKNKLLKVDSFGNSKEEMMTIVGSEIWSLDWRIDSDKAIEIAKKNGVKKFPIISIKLEQRSIDTEWELRTWEGWFKINAENGNFSKTTATK